MNRHDGWHRDLRRQRIIDQLARNGRGRPVTDLRDELGHRLEAELLLPMPPSWLAAVATSAADGNPYVISTRTAHSSRIPPPQSTDHPFGVS